VYIDQLARALMRVDGVELETVANRNRRRPAGGGLGSARNLISDWWWTARELPRMARRAKADLLHHPLPARVPRSPVAQVITVHDLAFERLPEHFNRRFRAYAHRTHRAAALSADAVLCVSETTAADVRDLWGVSDQRIVVAPHGPGQQLAQPPAATADRVHFLYVGDAEPRKNLDTLVAAYERYRERSPQPLPLVLAGSAAVDAPGVTIVADPGAGRLGDLYAAAAALIQPSLYEGFGLTALEAMSAGTPVIASDVPGLREICGPAADYIDPHRPESLARAMARLADEPARRAELAELGLRRAAEFTWDSCARAHVAAYSLALSDR
jgi:glycosyltransferase involved in cell wall biosynthesis